MIWFRGKKYHNTRIFALCEDMAAQGITVILACRLPHDWDYIVNNTKGPYYLTGRHCPTPWAAMRRAIVDGLKEPQGPKEN
jgi:hypothetical protein